MSELPTNGDNGSAVASPREEGSSVLGQKRSLDEAGGASEEGSDEPQQKRARTDAEAADEPAVSESAEPTSDSTPAAEAAAAPAPPAGDEPHVLGVCKWFDLKKGYGFVHQPGYQGMKDGTLVTFRLSRDSSGRTRAEDITNRDGTLLEGHPTPALLMQQQQQQMHAGGPAVGPDGKRALPPHTTATLPEGRRRGSVKWFDVKKGFGFISADNSEEIFVHQSCVKGRSLTEGENVEFSVFQDPARPGFKAKDVTGPGGAAPIGQQATPVLPSTPIMQMPGMMPGMQPMPAMPMYPFAYPSYPGYPAYPGYPQQPQPQAQAAPAQSAAPAPGYGYPGQAQQPVAQAPAAQAQASPYAAYYAQQQQQQQQQQAYNPYGAQAQSQPGQAQAAAQPQYDAATAAYYAQVQAAQQAQAGAQPKWP